MAKIDDFHHVLLSLRETPWALAATHAPVVAMSLAELAAGKRPTAYAAAPIDSRSEIQLVPARNGQRVAIVPARGLVLPDFDFQPFCFSARKLAHLMQELLFDRTISSIVIAMDSPGGTCVYTPEAADAVYSTAIGKPVHVVVGSLCASAAYHIASGATSISCLPSGSGVGSIGVRMMHVDVSRALEQMGVKVTHIHAGEFKVEGNQHEPLSAEARARYLLECETIMDGFVAAVARGRNVSAKTVREKYGRGRVFMPAEARRVGMIDSLATPDAAIAGIVQSGGGKSSAAELEQMKAQLALAAL